MTSLMTSPKTLLKILPKTSFSTALFTVTVLAVGQAAGAAPSATTEPKSQPPVVRAQAMDSFLSEAELRQAGFQPTKRRPPAADALVKRETREAWLKEAGLNAAVARMDELSRDLLVQWARRLSPQELASRYDKLPRAGLDRLVALARSAR